MIFKGMNLVGPCLGRKMCHGLYLVVSRANPDDSSKYRQQMGPPGRPFVPVKRTHLVSTALKSGHHGIDLICET